MNTIPTALGLTSEQVETLLLTAGRAPSLHNTQPWRFRLQMDDPAFRAELTRWTATGPDRRGGWTAATPQHRWVVRDFRSADSRPATADFEENPVIAVLTAHLTGERADVQVGQALERILLTATVNGLAVSFLSQIVEVPQTREELRRLVGGTRPPQAVLRIGRGYPVNATPRRPVAELVDTELQHVTSGQGIGLR